MIGVLCVMDYEPHRITDAQLNSVRILARQTMFRLESTARLRTLDREARAKTRIEQALTVERNFVSAALDTVGSLVLVLDTAGRIVRFNRASESISGYTFSELVGRPFWEKLVAEHELPQVMERFDALRRGETPQFYEHAWITRKGQRRQIAWSATTLRDAQGVVNFIIATGTDITERRNAEAVLRESEARYRQLIEGSLGMICTHDADCVLLSINRNAARSLGYEVSEMVGRKLQEFVPPHFLDEIREYQDTIAREGEDQGTFQLMHKNGEIRYIAYRNRLIQVEGREPFVLGHGIDVTAQTRTEKALRSLSRQSETILDSVGDGIWSMDPEGRCTIVNPAAAEMFGYRREELIGRNMHELVHSRHADGSPYPQNECRINSSLNSSEPVRVSNEVFWRKDGSSFPVEYIACPQIDGGRAVGMVVAFQDVTERRALDRMKDEFISTVSHELRTPLTSLRAALGLISGGTLQNRPEKQQQMLDIAVGNCDRLVQLVNDILDLEHMEGGKLHMHFQTCDMDQVLRRAGNLMESAAYRADVQIEIAETNIQGWADPQRILQALTNLVGNAIKFSHRGGIVRMHAKLISSEELLVTVCDQGRGIPSTQTEAIFERFHQVDASDSRIMGGTGLGLAICRSIISQHGGRIWVESRMGEGSCFYFTLPRRERRELLNLREGRR
jgi:PAS domain S-box-containing protein